MASISVPTALPAHPVSAFDALSHMSLPSGGPSHSRRHSHTHSPPHLPVFALKPGAIPEPQVQQNSGGSRNLVRSTVEEMTPTKQPRRALKPPPLPDFTFNPGATVTDPEPSPSPTHPILEEMAESAHNKSRRSAPRPVVLPAFSFNPGATDLQPSPSPTATTFSDTAHPGRSVGRRRRGSELIGVDGFNIISTSPQKSEAPSHRVPPASGLGPARYSHQHRRSQAVSISDIETSELIKANAVARHRAGSAPTTPGDPAPDGVLTERCPPPGQPISDLDTNQSASLSNRRGSAPGLRPRVGFSDTVDVIPRPLSLISSETEGSTSTIRAGHSLSGSLNSLGAASPPARSNSLLSHSYDDTSSKPRPRTADAASPSTSGLSRTEKRIDESALPKRPLSASDSPALFTSATSPPSRKKHFWFTSSNENSPKPSPRTEQPDPMATASPAPQAAPTSEFTRFKTSPERTASLRKRKVRTWTGAIFSRKGKARAGKVKTRRTPTPPLQSRRKSNSINDSIFDADSTVVLRNSPSPIRRHNQSGQTNATTTVTSLMSENDESEDLVASAMIDLDAALGPLGSEERIGSDESPRTITTRTRKQLHSSMFRGQPDPFGNVHRRAESAPSLPLVNRNTFGLRHMGSSSSIVEDVFDEEEEDDFLASESQPSDTAGKSTASTPSRSDGHSVSVSASPIPKISPAALSGTEHDQTPENPGLAITAGLHDFVSIVEMDETIGRDHATSSSSSTTAAILPQVDVSKHQPAPSRQFAYSRSQAPCTSSTEGLTATKSATSPPDPDHVAFESQPRSNRFLNERRPDTALRVSTDDLPSLTDSVSTGAVPRFSSSAGTQSSTEQRSASFSAPTNAKINQAWKRSSLASLNKLLLPTSSHGEKSKLCFGESVENFEVEKCKKKGNRISRLLNFWRSKEQEDH